MIKNVKINSPNINRYMHMITSIINRTYEVEQSIEKGEVMRKLLIIQKEMGSIEFGILWYPCIR
jgi:hypothetical protein